MSYLQNFNYRIDGQKSPKRLVFLHGLMGYAQNWRSVIRHFTKDYQVLSYDQRGHGKSFQPEHGYSPQDYAEDLHKILAELEWEKITLIGHSMGGRNALEYAHLYPESLRALVIVDIGPDYNLAAVAKIERIFQLAPSPFSSKEDAKNIFSKNFSTDLANYLYSNLEENTQGNLDWRFSKQGVMQTLLKGREKSRWQEWKDLNMPVLLMRGERSEDLSAEVFEEMLRTNAKAKGITIKDAGHWLHFEQKDAFCAALEDFLSALKH